MQSDKVWIYTQRSNLLVKAIVKDHTILGPYKILDDQDMRQKRVKLRKMFVD